VDIGGDQKKRWERQATRACRDGLWKPGYFTRAAPLFGRARQLF